MAPPSDPSRDTLLHHPADEPPFLAPAPTTATAFHFHPDGGFAPGPMTPLVEGGTRSDSPPSTLFANLLSPPSDPVSLPQAQVSGTGVHPGMANGKPGGDCRRLCTRHQRMAHEGTNRSLQLALESMSPADQEAVNTVWTLFSSSHASRRRLMLSGLLTICCPSQLSYLSESMKHVCRIDPFAVLPKEISLNVLSYVDAISLGRCAQVSKAWQKLADDDLLWRTMCQQHIERKCEKCGWGLPLMEKRRRANQKAAAKPGATEKQKVLAAAAAVGTVPSGSVDVAMSIPGHDHEHDHTHDDLEPARPHKRVRTGDGETASTAATTRPWKSVYTERLALERNWRKGTCTVSILEGHSDAITCLQVEENLSCLNWSVLMTGSWDRSVKVWNLDSGECVGTLVGHTRGVRCLRFDAMKLVTGSMDATIKIWNWRTGACLRTIQGHTDAVISLTYDNELLVSGSADSSVRVWNFTTGAAFVLRGHREWVNSVALWSPDMACDVPSLPADINLASSSTSPSASGPSAGSSSSGGVHKLLFSGSDDGQIRVWDLFTRDCVRVLEGHVAQVQSIRVITIDETPDSVTPPAGVEAAVVSTGSGKARSVSPLPDPSHPSQVTSGNAYAGFFEDANGLRPSRGPFLAANQTTGGPPAAHFFQRAATLAQPEGLPPLDLGSGNAKPLLVSGSLDNCVKVWDLEKGTCARTMFGHIEGVWSVDADRLRIVRSLKIWDRGTGRCMHTLAGHRGAVTTVSLGDDKIVTGSDDGDVRVWSFAARDVA